MSKDIKSGGMLSPKHFVRLLGAEYELMQGTGVLKRFYISALLLLAILLTTLISMGYALDLLFHTLAIEITLAIFFSLLFICIYIFLLNTFAKSNNAKKGIFSFSNIIRMGFVVFIAFLVAQPLVILCYADTLSPSVDLHKQQIAAQHAAKTRSLMADEQKNLQKRHDSLIQQKKLFATTAFDRELNAIAGRLESIEDKIASIGTVTQQTVGRNSFFLFRIKTVNRQYPLSWLLIVLVILLFLIPGYLIFTIPGEHEYYQLKKYRDAELVLSAYKDFVVRYKKMFEEPVMLFTRYEDPPFNTIRKELPEGSPTSKFLQKYLFNG